MVWANVVAVVVVVVTVVVQMLSTATKFKEVKVSCVRQAEKQGHK